jgi:Zn-dependent protease
MREFRVEISPGAAIFFAAVYVLLDFSDIAALALAAAVHELGHIAALGVLGARVRRLRFGMDGLCIVYTGAISYPGQFAAALAGPLAGAALAIIFAGLGAEMESGFLYVCAGLSAALSVFNLLPALPWTEGECFRRCCAPFCRFSGRRERKSFAAPRYAPCSPRAARRACCLDTARRWRWRPCGWR